MGMDKNSRGVYENGRKMDLIQGSHPPWRRERERCTNVLRNWFILQLISNVELQSCIYRRLALLSLAHMA